MHVVGEFGCKLIKGLYLEVGTCCVRQHQIRDLASFFLLRGLRLSEEIKRLNLIIEGLEDQIRKANRVQGTFICFSCGESKGDVFGGKLTHHRNSSTISVCLSCLALLDGDKPVLTSHNKS